MKIERAFIEIIERMLREKGMSKKEFASQIWSDIESPESKWQRIANGSKDGKPQKITLDEAAAMAVALGVDLPYMVYLVSQAVKRVEHNGHYPTPASIRSIKDKKGPGEHDTP